MQRTSTSEAQVRRRMAAVLQWLLSLLMLLCLTAIGGTARAEPAIEQFRRLQEELRRSREAADGPLSVRIADEQQHLLNGSPLSLLELARAQVLSGDLGSATGHVAEFVHMGQFSALLESSQEFAPLRGLAAYPSIREVMHGNTSQVSLATVAIRLSSTTLLAEDVDYAAQTKRFYVTSIREKRIVSVNADGSLETFASAPDDWPMLAIKIDGRRHVVWATEAALHGLIFSAQEQWGRSAVLAYDLRTAKLLRRIEAPRGSALGDMTVSANGDVLVSDGEGGGLYRVRADADHMERMDAGDFISPQTPAILPDGNQVLVPDYVRGLAVLDLRSRQVRWLEARGRFALAGIDGLNLDRGILLAVQNGASPERVVAFKLDTSVSRIEATTVLERATVSLGDPTHGVIVGRDYYYIANSGWDMIDGRGAMKPGAQPTEPLLMRIPLKLIRKELGRSPALQP
jgi:sugar lactone lactonase YvrE